MTEQQRHILFKIKPALQGDQIADAIDIEFDSTGVLNVLNGSGDIQKALNRLDSTGIGAEPKTFTGSFFANYVEGTGNQGTWYASRQSNTVIGALGQSNGNYTFELPDVDELNDMFDDLQSKGLGQVFTITIGYLGGSTSSVIRNSLTVRAPSVSALFDRNEIPVTISQGASVTFRIDRSGGSLSPWERISVQSSTDPVATFGEVVLQNVSWNNRDGSFLPTSATVQKGYAFPVIGSNPNDGTLRQGLLDAGVSDREIYDGDYVIWTADTFTSWVDGDNWFVLTRNDLQRLTREESNFLSQVSEIDNRVDLAPVESLTNDALVWLSESPLTLPPFLTPSTDPDNPRDTDDYEYIGGRDNRDSTGNFFQFSSNRFNNYITLGITPDFVNGHQLSDIFIYIRDTDGTIIETLNLETDFTLRDDDNWSNSTVTHYIRNISVNYEFLATIEIWLTQVQRHFRLNSNSVDVTENIPVESITEAQLSKAIQTKLNAETPSESDIIASVEPQLCPYINITHSSPEINALFLNGDATTTYPSDLSTFNAVSADNPRFTGNNVILFVAVPEPGAFTLRNITTSTDTALIEGTNVDVIQSVYQQSTQRTFFVYRVSNLTSGHIYEIERNVTERVLKWPNDIDVIQEDIDRIDSQLDHAVFDLPDSVVQIMENEISVTEQSNPTVLPTTYNKQLAGPSNTTQTVFYEPNPNTGSGGLLNSKPFSDLTGDQVQRKIVYLPPSTSYANQAYLTAFDGSTSRDLIIYLDGVFNAQVFVPAKSAGSSIETIYPAPANKISGAGIWINIPALTFVNGIPVPEADEVLFTRDIPSASTTLTIQYRAHSNGNVIGSSSKTLSGVGGSSNALTSFTIQAGSEQATVEILYRSSSRDIRVSVTEAVYSGFPTINDIEVILSYTETRTIPATPATTRNVPIENLHEGYQVFALKPSQTDTLIIVGDRTEIDTGYSYSTLFGASQDGFLTVTSEDAIFFNYEDFEPISSTITDLENHATLPQFGLFTTQYTHATLVALDTQFSSKNLNGATVTLGDPTRGGGHFSTETTTCTNADTDYKVDATFTPWPSKNITWNATTKRFEVSGGKFDIRIDVDWTASPSSSAELEYRLYKNGTAITGISRSRSFQNANSKGALSMGGIVTLTTADYIELYVRSDTAAVTVTTTETQITMGE